MRRLIAALTAPFLTLASASAATVTYDGATSDLSEAASISLTTAGPTAEWWGTTGSLDVAVGIGGDTYTLSEDVYLTLLGSFFVPYDLSVNAAAGTVTLTLNDQNAVGPDALGRLTLRYASALPGQLTLGNVFAWMTSAPLLSFEAETQDGQQSSVTVGAVAVPLPGAAWLFLCGAGAGVAAARRLR